jgi:hypothetical protein
MSVRPEPPKLESTEAANWWNNFAARAYQQQVSRGSLGGASGSSKKLYQLVLGARVSILGSLCRIKNPKGQEEYFY